ncbi:MAG TPA: single-stranded DNA-binding protein [Bacteroidales bacterium]
MAGLNKVILIGNVGKDPEVRQFDNGGKKISFSLATNESYKDKDGAWQDQTEWHNIVGWGFLADRPIAKGDTIYVEGKIKSRDYKDKDGNTRYITEILAERFNMILRRGDGTGAGQQSSYKSNESAPPDENSPADDLPF